MTFRLALFIALLVAGSAEAFDDVGQTNEAVPRSDARILFWANGVAELVRGPQDYQQPELGPATFGSETDPLGAAGTPVSLGDGGSITFTFEESIADGPGVDFAVFENGFPFGGGVFMELAFVEVSTDGVDFARLPAFCRRTTQPGPFDGSDPDDFYNLGGNLLDGTGIDLFDLVAAGEPLTAAGVVDRFDVRYVRLVDVVGHVDGPGATFDHLGRAVADPYATPFESGGMDATGVAVLHAASTVAAPAVTTAPPIVSRIVPNPVADHARLTLNVAGGGPITLDLYDVTGRRLARRQVDVASSGPVEISWEARDRSGRLLSPGVYFLREATGKARGSRLIVAR